MTFTKTSFLDIKRKVAFIRELFETEDFKIKESSFLNKLLTSIESISDTVTEQEAIKSLDVNRLYEALIIVESFENKKSILKRISKGKLDFNDDKDDDGKNILFELEIAVALKNHGLDVKFGEPDLVVTIDDKLIGIACKKVYSIKNFQKLISKGVHQIKDNYFDYGIVAINIDNILPVGHLLNINSKIDASAEIHKINYSFYIKNHNYISKYLIDNRLQAVLINTSLKIDIKDETPRFNTLSETLICVSSKETNKSLNNELKKIFNN